MAENGKLRQSRSFFHFPFVASPKKSSPCSRIFLLFIKPSHRLSANDSITRKAVWGGEEPRTSANEIRSHLANGFDFFFFLPLHGRFYDPNVATIGVHPDRAPGGDRHHRSAHRSVVAGGAESPRSGQSHQLPEQSAPDLAGGAELPQRVQSVPAGDELQPEI